MTTMQDEAKRRAAEYAIALVNGGQVVGLGTGSTAKFAIEGLGRRISEGLSIKGVPTSLATEKMAREVGIPLVDLNDVHVIDITLDGADEVDHDFNMIKGGGGALTREKLVALASKRRVILVDESKLVSELGQSRSLPVEVLPFAWALSARRLSELGCTASLRHQDGLCFVTDNGNYILDCEFGAIADPPALERKIKLQHGVIESGLFIGIADMLVVGFDDRVEVKQRLH
jgi:ribose 5-phosphate isomerase A